MINIDNLGKKFNDHWIIRNINIKIFEGESVVLIGPSGSGKTLLFKLITKLIKPDEGTIEIKNTHISMVFQKNALFDSLTVLENLLYTLKHCLNIKNKLAIQQATQILEIVGLNDCADKFPSQISGGMQKRLGIARALVINPKIIFYDEPTAGLDPITSRKIAELIISFQKQNQTTILTITNEMKRAFQIADRIYFLSNGKLIHCGTPKDLENSKCEEVLSFIRGRPYEH